MLFNQTTLFLLASLALAKPTSVVGDSNKLPRRLKKSKKGKGSKNCVEESSCEATTEAFVLAVPRISRAFFGTGEFTGMGDPGGDAKTAEEVIHIADNDSNKDGCQRAYEQAMGALAVAYDYQNGEREVLFKPTYTSYPNTYRNTLAGALSYLIGTECLLLADTDIIYPTGNDGTIFQEYGFCLANSPTTITVEGVVEEVFNQGWFDSESYDFDYRTGGKNCKTAVGLGRICFVYNLRGTETSQVTTCVDKTFSYVTAEAGNALDAKFTSHHSSASIVESPPSIVYCQEPSEGNPSAVTNDVTTCVVGYG